MIDSVELPLRVQRMKATFITSNMEGGKQVVQEQIVTGKFTPRNPSTIVEYTHTMHASVKTFMETDFSSYLHLGEHAMEGLFQLCNDRDVEENQHEGSSYKVRPSSSPPGK